MWDKKKDTMNLTNERKRERVRRRKHDVKMRGFI
jgi:hypothetical protein